MKRVIVAILLVAMSVGTMASKCQPVFERKCEEAGGITRSDPEAPEKLKCYKDGKEIPL